jgi:hypothetical protein
MKKIFILTLSTLFFFSCDTKSEKDDALIKAGQELNLSDNRALNDEEYTIATNICSALEEKNLEIQRMVGFSKRFSFARAKKYCGGQEFQLGDFGASLTAPATFGETPEFKSATNSNTSVDDFIYRVFVENDQAIKVVCDKILSKGQRPNLIEESGNFQIKYRFFANNQLELAVYNILDGKWMPYRFDIMKVILSSGSERHGMLLERYSGAYCRSNNQDISYIKQVMR